MPNIDDLIEKYPKIFREHKLPMTQTAMCWGLAVGPGWRDIIDNACSAIQWHIDHERKDRASILRKKRKGEKLHKWEEDFLLKPVCRQFVATQVKEKFGTLRFYFNNGDEYCDGVISMAEHMSAVTCEQCGSPGKVGGQGWITTLCEPCRNAKGK